MPPTPARRIAGWAVRWDWPSTIDCSRRGRFIETLAPYCFREAIAAGEVELLINHDPSNGVVARQADGSLIVSQDASGLWFEAEINDTLLGEEALTLVRGAGYRAASVGMTRVMSDWSMVDGTRHRRITASGLREVSLCSRGAHLSARIAAGRLPIDALRREGRLAHLAAAEAAIASRRAA